MKSNLNPIKIKEIIHNITNEYWLIRDITRDHLIGAQ